MDKMNILNAVPVKQASRSYHDLTHDVKLSCDMGTLVPIMTEEVVPGDSITISHESLIRFAPMISPAMHRFNVYVHSFFVPCRILWEGFENFIMNEPDPVTGVVPVAPYFEAGFGKPYTRTMDYMGLPAAADAGNATYSRVNALPFQGYQLIYDQYYRDQNLIPSNYVELNDGFNPQPELIEFRRRCWEHDYFTAALPFAQKGQAVQIPLAGFNDVAIKVNQVPTGAGARFQISDVSGNYNWAPQEAQTSAGIPADSLYADTSSLTAAQTTIRDLRRAEKLQEFLERKALGGSRYFEYLRSVHGVNSPDARLQRPEYIGGSKTPIIISEVLNNADNGTSPQGNMAGHGVGVMTGEGYQYYCQEHGFIISIMSIMPKTCYQQGIPKFLLKTQDTFQYFNPFFENIGEQEVLNKEVYAYGNTPDDTFGYVPRYAEYKVRNSRVCGDFRTSLDYWHEGRIFANQPQLNDQFVICNPSDRIFAVSGPGVDNIYAQILCKISAMRPMQKFGVPAS